MKEGSLRGLIFNYIFSQACIDANIIPENRTIPNEFHDIYENFQDKIRDCNSVFDMHSVMSEYTSVIDTGKGRHISIEVSGYTFAVLLKNYFIINRSKSIDFKFPSYNTEYINDYRKFLNGGNKTLDALYNKHLKKYNILIND